MHCKRDSKRHDQGPNSVFGRLTTLVPDIAVQQGHTKCESQRPSEKTVCSAQHSLRGAHCVQLSYSSPTFGASGLYVREGVSSSFFTARISSTRPPASAISRTSTPSALAGGVAWNACTVGIARQATCKTKHNFYYAGAHCYRSASVPMRRYDCMMSSNNCVSASGRQTKIDAAAATYCSELFLPCAVFLL